MKKHKIAKLITNTFVVMLSLIVLFPFYSMIIMGTHLAEDLMTSIKLWPGRYLLKNLNTVFSTDYTRFYFNSFYIAMLTTCGAIITSSMAGFAFAKYRFKGRRFLYTCVLATLMVPMQLNLVGFVMELRLLNQMNKHFGLIFPSMANAFFVFWTAQYIKTAIPNEVLESARIDGSGDFRTFFSIVFPMIRPSTITIFLLAFLASWNNYITPLVVLTNQKLYTLPLAITLFSTTYRNDYAASILALTLATLPIVIMFSFGSKYLVMGMTTGSVKG